MLSGRNEYLRNLLNDAKEGDINSFGVIFAYTYQDIFSQCKVYLNREYDIQDIMLNTYLTAYKRLNEVSGAEHVGRWISLICDGQINNFLLSKNLTRQKAKSIAKTGRSKNPIKQMSIENAQQIFDSVLILSGAKTDALPLEALLAYHQYRNNRLLLQRGILLVAILALVFVPFFALSPEMSLSPVPNSNNGVLEKYTINVKSLVPVDYVKATLDGKDVTTMIENDNMYTSYITGNGEYEVTVTLINRKSITKSVYIKDFDMDPPVVDEYYLENGNLIIQCSDEMSGLDYKNTFITRLSNSEVINALSYDENEGVFIFPYIPGDSALTISDKDGNKATFTID